MEVEKTKITNKLIGEAMAGGQNYTEHANQALSDAFEQWLSDKGLPSEYDWTESETRKLSILRLAFEKGFGICVHDPKLEKLSQQSLTLSNKRDRADYQAADRPD
jgi:hypothetical protein